MKLNIRVTAEGANLLEHNEQIGSKALGEGAMGLLYEISNNELSEDSPLGTGTLDEIATLASYNLIEVNELPEPEEYCLEVTLADGTKHYPSHEPDVHFEIGSGVAKLYQISDGAMVPMSQVTHYTTAPIFPDKD